MVATLGTAIKLADRIELAVLIVPTAYIPPSFPCPALGEDNLCGIQGNKPSRCKSMPLYPYREEQYQAELLTPRKGWSCDTSSRAPLIFQEKKVVYRDDFDRERQDLLEQVSVVRRYAEYMLKYSPSLSAGLIKASGKIIAANVVTSLSSFLTATRNRDAEQIADLQSPLLNDYAAKTAGNRQLLDFHRNYLNWYKEMAYLSTHERQSRSSS